MTTLNHLVFILYFLAFIYILVQNGLFETEPTYTEFIVDYVPEETDETDGGLEVLNDQEPGFLLETYARYLLRP